MQPFDDLVKSRLLPWSYLCTNVFRLEIDFRLRNEVTSATEKVERKVCRLDYVSSRYQPSSYKFF